MATLELFPSCLAARASSRRLPAPGRTPRRGGRARSLCCRSSSAGGRGGSSGGGGGPPASRREFVLRCVVQWAVLGDLIGESVDAQTVVNSILGAYGLPQLGRTPGFRVVDDFNAEYVFESPKGWVGRRNTQRPGVYYSDFQTADKLTVEEVPLSATEPPSERELAQLAVTVLINPGGVRDPEVGGDARLELPPTSSIKSSSQDIDNVRYVYLAFPSSGYDIRRKNFAVAAVKRGTVYILGASSRKDLYSADKEALLKHIVASFRLR